ncbi:hypothetical protein [Tuwongella immobilis]|uniref:Uncharacterized protein n=1 Tax=Tuwongella immobilis TaxID=692036 RepID=A0A6C2YTP6_9BACT|nr:hypothetical protein [Tuwongella immobilis]VIP04761.1 Putative uncharacterized protein OS=Caldithrix abyssi DSM 13497 GN=Calab_2821 PE=4 SV=1 [Tuwongella immobilis]VTS06881.1 Putative uncharacterized protein OS=Caldithrix abyssi DSM 13497 GN=Calab_2821 PE=4 SV=1 [Tuwongella immobilis]
MWMRSVTFVGAILVILSQSASGQDAKAVPAAPKSLLIFYGWPSTINGANGNVQAAAKHFANYDLVVIGGELESPSHPDHRNTAQILQLAKRKTQFFGYVPLGNRKGTDMCLPQAEIAKRMALLKAFGVKGVLLDEFGFDYGVDRDRQNLAVQAAHNNKLTVIANAWNPDDVFLPDQAGVAPALAPGDAYLWESYRFSVGKPVDQATWRVKADKIAAGRKKLPLLVYSVSTNEKQPNNALAQFTHQWYSASIDGHEATGWGYPGFAAGDSQAPLLWFKRPTLGNTVNAPIQVNGTTIRKATTKGIIEVDTKQLTGTFTPSK